MRWLVKERSPTPRLTVVRTSKLVRLRRRTTAESHPIVDARHLRQMDAEGTAAMDGPCWYFEWPVPDSNQRPLPCGAPERIYPQIGPMLGRSNWAYPKVESVGPNRTSTFLTEVLERNLSPCNTIE